MKINQINKTHSILTYIFGSIMIMLGLYVIWKNLVNPWLWYDESIQFWISKGMNPYAAPSVDSQGLMQVIETNRYYNMDPGGFSILLHFWLMISNSAMFIRLFPLLFFGGFSYLIYKYQFFNTNDKFYSFICAIMVFLLPTTISRMVEIRAYSMELMGIVWALYFVAKAQKNNYDIKNLLFLSIGMAIFCTSRFEYVVVAFVVAVYTCIEIIIGRSQVIKKLILFGSPLLLSVLAIIYFTLQYQNPEIERVDYLFYLCDTPSLFYKYLFLLFALNTVFVLYQCYKNKKLTQLQLLSLLIPSAFVVLSLLGKYPWDTTRTISVYVVIFINMANELYERFKFPVLIKLAVLFILFWGHHYRIPHGTGLVQYEAFKEVASNKTSADIVYVDDWFAPSVRYAYEYGCFKDRASDDGYPDSFIFQRVILEKVGKYTKYVFLDLPSQTEADIYLIGRNYVDADKSLSKDSRSPNIYTKRQ